MKPAEGSTVIGPSVRIRGELSASEDLYLDGDIEGTITLPEHGLTIGPNARILAEIHAKDLTVFGKVTGNLHVSRKVDIRQSAVVNGDIFGGRLAIEENATIKGKVSLGENGHNSGPAAVGTGSGQETLFVESKV